MNDIVVRLRAISSTLKGNVAPKLIMEAADEIELLRKVHLSALAAVSEASAVEREACAKIADAHANAYGSRDECDQISARTGASIAEEIRYRSTK